MSCTDFDLRDYFFGELPESERTAAERHLSGCVECGAGLEQLEAIRGGLLALRDEEPPQRIGFVSDKVFQPSPVRRWLSDFWLSGARIGFVSAAMLSVALLVFAARQPKVIEKRVEVAVSAAPAPPQVDVKAVVAAALAEQDSKTHAILAAAERKHQTEERALAMRVSEYITNVDKRLGSQRMVAYNFSPSEESAMNALLIALTLVAGLVVTKPLVKREFMEATENELKQDLVAHEIDVFGVPRGMYVDGVGVVFSTDVSLVYTPMITPFQQVFPPAQKQAVHERKLRQVPILIEQMRQAVLKSAGSLDALPMKENIIVGVSIGYQSWEDKSDLPSQIVVQAQKQKVLEAKLAKASTDSIVSVQIQQ